MPYCWPCVTATDNKVFFIIVTWSPVSQRQHRWLRKSVGTPAGFFTASDPRTKGRLSVFGPIPSIALKFAKAEAEGKPEGKADCMRLSLSSARSSCCASPSALAICGRSARAAAGVGSIQHRRGHFRNFYCKNKGLQANTMLPAALRFSCELPSSLDAGLDVFI